MTGASKLALNLSQLTENVFVKIASYLSKDDLMSLEKSGMFEQDEDGHAEYITLAFQAMTKYTIKHFTIDDFENDMSRLIRCSALMYVNIRLPHEYTENQVVNFGETLAQRFPCLRDVSVDDMWQETLITAYIKNLPSNVTSFEWVTLHDGLSEKFINRMVVSSPLLTSINLVATKEMARLLNSIGKLPERVIQLRLSLLARLSKLDAVPDIIAYFQQFSTVKSLTVASSIDGEMFDGIEVDGDESDLPKDLVEQARDEAFKAIGTLAVERMSFEGCEISENAIVFTDVGPFLKYLNPKAIREVMIKIEKPADLVPYLRCTNLEHLNLQVGVLDVKELVSVLKSFKMLKTLSLRYLVVSNEDIVTYLELLGQLKLKVTLQTPKLENKSIPSLISLLESTNKWLIFKDASFSGTVEPEEYSLYLKLIPMLLKLPCLKNSAWFNVDHKFNNVIHLVEKDEAIVDLKRISGFELNFECTDASYFSEIISGNSSLQAMFASLFKNSN